VVEVESKSMGKGGYQSKEETFCRWGY